MNEKYRVDLEGEMGDTQSSVFWKVKLYTYLSTQKSGMRGLWEGESYKNKSLRSSLVVERLRRHLPVQGNRFDPWSGKIPHAKEQLSLLVTATEPAHPRDCTPQQEKPLQ